MSIDEKKLRAWLEENRDGWDAHCERKRELGDRAEQQYCQGRAASHAEVLRWLDANAAPVSLETGDGPGTVIVDGKSVQAESAEGARALAVSAAGGPGHGPIETGSGASPASDSEGSGETEHVQCWTTCTRCGAEGDSNGDFAHHVCDPAKVRPKDQCILCSRRMIPAPEGDTEEQDDALADEQAQRGPSTSDYKPRAAPNGSTVVQRAVNQALKDAGSPRRINSHIAADAVHAMEAMGWRLDQAASGDTEEPRPIDYSSPLATVLTGWERMKSPAGQATAEAFCAVDAAVAKLREVAEHGDTETVTLYRPPVADAVEPEEWAPATCWPEDDQERLLSAEFARVSLCRPALPSEGAPDSPRCGRLLVGQGGDTWDPECGLARGHKEPCRPVDEEATDAQ